MARKPQVPMAGMPMAMPMQMPPLAAPAKGKAKPPVKKGKKGKFSLPDIGGKGKGKGKCKGC